MADVRSDDPRIDDRGRPEPPLLADEVATLTGFLDYQRATLDWKCRGLSDEQLRVSLPPTSMTLGGMLKHLAYYEDHWFSHRLRGNERQAVWNHDYWEWNSAAGDSPDTLHTLWRDAVSRSRDLLSATLADGGLDQLARRSLPDGGTPSVRWTVVHMVEEYGRHNGHADLIRESVDGLVGE